MRFCFYYIRLSTLLWKRHPLYQIFFLCTSYFSLCLIWDEYLNTLPKSNVWKPGWKQTDTCKFFTLFQNFVDLCQKNHPLFLISRIRACLWKITRESGYEHGKRFDREGGGELWVVYTCRGLVWICGVLLCLLATIACCWGRICCNQPGRNPQSARAD